MTCGSRAVARAGPMWDSQGGGALPLSECGGSMKARWLQYAAPGNRTTCTVLLEGVRKTPSSRSPSPAHMHNDASASEHEFVRALPRRRPNEASAPGAMCEHGLLAILT